jgi:hypothetical protein
MFNFAFAAFLQLALHTIKDVIARPGRAVFSPNLWIMNPKSRWFETTLKPFSGSEVAACASNTHHSERTMIIWLELYLLPRCLINELAWLS